MTIYKRFRSVPKIDANTGGDRIGSGRFSLSSRFDQPSYLSFRIIFAESDAYYNNAASEKYVLNYDRMPHPLFMSKGKDNVFERESYSSIDYLLDANEFTRAEMLSNFIDLWNRMQYNYQWYFQKIDGIGELLKIDPTKGMRVTSDKRLSITALEGLDLRMSHMLNLYRKIAWDDTYQRWVLPDMMRYFTLDIYISEFRTFHTPNPYSGYGTTGESNKEAPTELRLNILDDILPVWKIKCEMCEIDVESIEYDYLSSLGVDSEPDTAGVKFDIKVGKVYEEQVFPTFKNAFLIDRSLNGLDRSRREETLTDNREETATGTRTIGSTTYQQLFDSTSPESNNNQSIYNNKLLTNVAQNQTYNSIEGEHLSGTPFNEQTNKETIDGKNAHEGLPLSEATSEESDGNNKSNNGWFRNAETLGISFLENKFEQIFDKTKITPIPGLGISFTEIKSALEGKNIITALGLLRKGVNDVVSQYGQPSELLEGDIYTDTAFREYLKGVSKSEATDEIEISLIEAANIALNDDGTWDKIKDFSLATDMTGPGEQNSENTIKTEGGYNQGNITSQATSNENDLSEKLAEPGGSTLNNSLDNSLDRGDESVATSGNVSSAELTGEESNINKKIPVQNIIEGVPSSQATTNKLQNG
jgi:hypothetical protein